MISYNPLWHTLLDRGMNKGDLKDATGLSVSVPCRGTTFLNTIPTIPPPVWAHGRDCVGKIFLEKQIKFIRLNRQQTQYLSHARQNPNRYSLLLRNINFTLSHHIFFPLIAGTFQNMW